MKLIIAPECHLFDFLVDPEDMEGVLRLGLRAITENLDRLNLDAGRVTRAFTPDSTEDVVSAIVDLKRDALGIRAGATIVSVGSDLYKYTLDIIA